MMHRLLPLLAVALPAAVPAVAQKAPAPRDAASLAADMGAGRLSSAAETRALLRRIEAVDRRGPALRSILALNPDAMRDAAALDRERRAGRVRGPLHGVPVIIKDNVEASGPLPTTAGSLALAANVTGRDAPLVARLRAAGAVILGKANLSEWANIRDSKSTSGWSAVGGLVRHPYRLDRNPCGSSSGSAVAVAAGLVPLAIGTETDGSITCPAGINGVVGLKPTVGLVSRSLIVPISPSQDTAGPMARSVRDAAMLLTAIAGRDPGDPATAAAPAAPIDYAAGLSPDALRGVRVGVLRPEMPAAVAARYDAALAVLTAAGATLVPATLDATPGIDELELTVLLTELKVSLDAYLATTPAAVRTRTLADVIAFNKAAAATELRYFGQDLFERAAATGGLRDPGYVRALAQSRRMATGALDGALQRAGAAVLVSPTNGPAWVTDLGGGDRFAGPSASQLPAIAGYPHLTVPMGLVDGLPVGLSFVGPKWSEARLLGAGFAYENRARARVAPRYLAPAR